MGKSLGDEIVIVIAPAAPIAVVPVVNAEFPGIIRADSLRPVGFAVVID